MFYESCLVMGVLAVALAFIGNTRTAVEHVLRVITLTYAAEKQYDP